MPAPPRLPRGLARAPGLALVLLAATPAAAEDAAEDVKLRGPEVVRIDLVPGKMGAVSFSHAQHALVLKRLDGSSTACRDCHHDLPGDRPAAGGPGVQHCAACHAALDEPPRAIAAMGGKVAPALVQRKEDRALDYRTVLFHAWCRDCHRKASPPGRKLHLCKVCHERGVGQDVMHGDATARE